MNLSTIDLFVLQTTASYAGFLALAWSAPWLIRYGIRCLRRAWAVVVGWIGVAPLPDCDYGETFSSRYDGIDRQIDDDWDAEPWKPTNRMAKYFGDVK